jgi:hypothetical protein
MLWLDIVVKVRSWDALDIMSLIERFCCLKCIRVFVLSLIERFFVVFVFSCCFLPILRVPITTTAWRHRALPERNLCDKFLVPLDFNRTYSCIFVGCFAFVGCWR